MRITLDARGWDTLGRCPTFAIALRLAIKRSRHMVVASLLAELAVAMREDRLPSLGRAWALSDAPDDDPGCVSGSPPYVAPETWMQAIAESDEIRREKEAKIVARNALQRAETLILEV